MEDSDGYGAAVEHIDRWGGRWWAHNREYATEVSFCPWCGRELVGKADDWQVERTPEPELRDATLEALNEPLRVDLSDHLRRLDDSRGK